MADEEVEVQELDEKDLRIKTLESELAQHKKLFDLKSIKRKIINGDI